MHQSIGLEIRRPQVETPHRLRFDQPYVIIGRSESCDLQLPHPAVSSRHAYLQQVDGRIMCVDLGSQTGTRWNDYAKQRDWLNGNDRVLIGPYELNLDPENLLESGSGDPCGTPPPPHPRVLLKVVRPAPRSGQQLLWPLRNPVNLIGRGRSCNIRVEHDSVMLAHCSLILAADGVYILDLLSEPGTLVNGQRVRYARLHSGNELKIGDVLFRILFEGQQVARRVNGNGAGRNGHSLKVDAVRPNEVAEPRLVAQATPSESPETPSPPPAVDAVEDNATRQPEASAPADTADRDDAAPQRERVSEPVEPAGRFLAGEMTLFALPQRHFSEEFVLSLMNQFAAMQMQQMTLMSEIFMGMQQRYLDFIRDDLGRVQQLTTELQTLQAQLLQRNLSFAALPAQVDPSAAESNNAPRNGNHRQPEEHEQPVTGKTRRQAAPAESESVAECSDAGSSEKPQAEQSSATSGRTHAANGETNRKRPEMDADEQYEWLLQRINAVERERNSRWKNILQTISGAKNNRD